MHPFRTHTCGDLRIEHANDEVRLSGWVRCRRDLGGVIFLDVGDSHGRTQVTANREDLLSTLRALRVGDLITVTGTVRERGARNVNVRMVTGEVEVIASDCEPRSADAAERVPWAAAEWPEPDGIERLVAAAGRIIDAMGFLEVRSNVPLWAGPFLPWRPERRARVAQQYGQLFVELDAAFVTKSEMIEAVTNVLQALVERVGRRCSAFSMRPWNDPRDIAPEEHVWSCGPSRMIAVEDGFPHDPCAILFAQEGSGVVFREGSVLDHSVAAFELRASGVCLGVGAIRNHDLEVQEQLCRALADAGPLVRARAAAHLSCIRRGAPPGGSFTLNLGALVGRRAKDTCREAPWSARGIVSWPGLEGALTKAAIDAIGLPVDEVRRRALRAERRDVEVAAALLASLSVPAGRPSARADIERLLLSSAITWEQTERLLELFPARRPRVLSLPGDELYQWLWSLLGNEFVREMIEDDNAYARLQVAVRRGVLTDYRHVVYLDVNSVFDLDVCLRRAESQGAAEAHSLIDIFRRVLAQQPPCFASLLAGLADADDGTWTAVIFDLRDTDGGRLRQAVRDGMCGPVALPLALEANDATAMSEVWEGHLRRQAAVLHPNNPVDVKGGAEDLADRLRRAGFSPASCARVSASPRSTFADVVFALYRPVNMSVRTIVSLTDRIPDCTSHISLLGIRQGGPHWRPERGCYSVALPSMNGGCIHLFPSKNSASFFSKASAGICTARDVALFARPSHLHVNIVASDYVCVLGNVQIHVVGDRGRRLLIVRAINASASWIKAETATDLINAVLVCCVEMAVSSGLDEVHIGEGLDLWHLNSGRPELRCVLDEYQSRFARLVLEEPLALFQFAGVNRSLSRTYRLWPLPAAVCGLAGVHPSTGILEPT